MITARRTDHTITRNCSYFKPFSGVSSPNSLENTDMDEPITNNPNEEARMEEPGERADHRYPTRRRHKPQFYRDEQY